MEYRPIGLPLRSLPRRCSTISASTRASRPESPRPPERDWRWPLAPLAPLADLDPLEDLEDLEPRDDLEPVDDDVDSPSLGEPDVSAPALERPPDPVGGGIGGAGRVSPIWGLRTMARSLASVGVVLRIGSGSSSSMRPETMSEASSSEPFVGPVDCPAAPAPEPFLRRCPPRDPRRRRRASPAGPAPSAFGPWDPADPGWLGSDWGESGPGDSNGT